MREDVIISKRIAVLHSSPKFRYKLAYIAVLLVEKVTETPDHRECTSHTSYGSLLIDGGVYTEASFGQADCEILCDYDVMTKGVN
jgi:hypothetical protein